VALGCTINFPNLSRLGLWSNARQEEVQNRSADGGGIPLSTKLERVTTCPD